MDEIKELGDYTIIKQIGQGALGNVYLAEHRYMKKQFALKVLPKDLCLDRSFIQRFEEEIGQLVTLGHPNIVKIHNISFADSHYFLVTDCIVDEVGETTNLAQYLKGRQDPLTEEETYHILHQIANALDYAHLLNGTGVTHRGIKFNNILVSKTKNGLQVHLSDYGLSRIIGAGAILNRTYDMVAETLGIKLSSSYVEQDVDQDKLSSLHHSFLQSFHFLAPEQKVTSKNDTISHKADNYAFGVLAYFILMQKYPEGFLDLPSSSMTHFKWNWDLLITSCLRNDPDKRPELLTSVLESVKMGKPVRQEASIGTKLEPNATAESYLVNPTAMEPVVARQQAREGEATANEDSLRPVIHVTQLERPEHDPNPAAALQCDMNVKHYVPERKETSNIQPLLTDMAVIQGGTFYRGSNDGNRDEMPRHKVTLESFAIDVHPVTNEQFVRFLEAMGGEKDSNHNDIIRLRDSRIKRSAGKITIESGYIKHPVVGVTWYGAVAYAKWVGKRLPTEAEWEIACCGGLEDAYYPTGEEIDKTQSNFFSSDTTPVMSYPKNGHGLYDIVGNVYEWCQDWYGYNYYETSIQEPENPKGPLQGVYRVLRGGCWKSLKEDLRCSRRHRNNPGTVNSTYGFRCAADVK